MEYEKFETIMKADYSNDDAIDDGVIQGIMVMRKYIPDADIEGAGHDVIYSVDISELIDAGIVEEDVIKLRLMGWHIEDEYLQHFV